MPTVIIIDDQLISRMILEELVSTIDEDLESHSFEDPVKALEWAKNHPVDLILADYKMPTLDGVQLTQWVRKIPTCADVPIIIVTCYDEQDLKYRALEAGATDFLTKPVDHHECRARCRNLLTMRRQQSIIRQRAFSLEKEIEGKTKELYLREKEGVLQLAKVSRYRDKVDEPHLLYLSHGARLMAQTMDYDVAFCDAIEYAAPLHDIGKIGLSDNLLKSFDALTAEQQQQFRRHTLIGHDLLIDSASGYLRTAAKIALNHHERYNGSGYPNQLKGDAIPAEAAIVGLLDVFGEMLADEEQYPSVDDAIQGIRQSGGQDFAMEYVEAFSQCVDQIMHARDVLATTAPSEQEGVVD